MRKCVCVILMLLMVTVISGCYDKDGDSGEKKLDGSKTLTGVNNWFTLSVNNDYDMFLANYGEVISEELYDQLQSLYKDSTSTKTEVCLMHTLEDGTRVLIVLELENAYWSQFSIKSIEILD